MSSVAFPGVGPACRWLIALAEAVALFVVSDPNPAGAVVQRVYTLPFYDNYQIVCGFACYSGHEGTDYQLGNFSAGGERVVVAAGGTAKPCPFSFSAGWYIVFDHGNGHRTRYLHLNAAAIPPDGALWGRGEVIGYEGNTGDVRPLGTYMLHFETRHGATSFTCGKDGTAVDPYGQITPGTYMWRTNPPLRAFDSWNLLSSASFEAGGFSPWAPYEGGTAWAVYQSSGSHSGSYFLETNTNVAGGSIYQDNYLAAPVPGESYVFSVRARSPTNQCVSVVLALWAIGGTSESNATGFNVCSAYVWTLISAPLDVGLGGHNGLRAQVYMYTTGRNLDIDTTEMVQVADHNASFERDVGWETPGWWTRNCNPGGVVWARYPGGAKTGGYYLEANTATSGGSICEDMSVVPLQGQSYVFSIWLRSPTSQVATGSVALWALGGTQEVYLTGFTLATSGWVQVSAPLDVRYGGHTGLRAEIYMNTTGRNYDFDGSLVYKNLFANGSFETGGYSPWANYEPQTNLAVYYGPSQTKSGSYFAETNTSVGNGSIFQDVGIQPQVGESYTFTIWARCYSTCPISGTLALWGLTNESQATNFTVSSTFYQPIVVPLDVKIGGHTGLRYQLYLATTGRTLRIDAGATSASSE